MIPVMDPKFGEVQADMPKIISEHCRKTGQEVPETLGEIADCVYRSLALEFKASFDDIMGILGKKLELLHIVGGGTQNKLLCQYTANAVGVPVAAGPTETTAFGNLIFQMMADGKISSLEEGRKMCAKNSEIFRFEPADHELWEEYSRKYLAYR